MAFPGTAPGQVLRRGCADRLMVAQGEQPGPLSLGVLLEFLDKSRVGQCRTCFQDLQLVRAFSKGTTIPGWREAVLSNGAWSYER